MKTTLWLLVSLTPLALGCAEPIEPPHTAADTRPREARLPVPSEDDFWRARQWSAEREPERQRPRSISLGYLGDGVLPGGITRDDPVPPPRPRAPGSGQTWQEYVNAPSWGSSSSWGSSTPPPTSPPPQRCRCPYQGAPVSY